MGQLKPAKKENGEYKREGKEMFWTAPEPFSLIWLPQGTLETISSNTTHTKDNHTSSQTLARRIRITADMNDKVMKRFN